MIQPVYSDTLTQGYELHWYELQSVLGRGGYGITYKASDRNLERDVAIKEYLPTDFAARQGDDTVAPITADQGELFQWGLDGFLKEARTLAKFNHPNIIRVLSVFEDNNTAYMVMEYEQGDDLASKLKQQQTKPTQEQLLDIFIPILDGLALVHQAGFIHRDIKPANIYIRKDNSPVLLDFGSARQTFSSKTRTLTSLVTVGYAPFEQYNNDDTAKQGAWSDIYALGATMYYCITGNKPQDAINRGSSILNEGHDLIVPLSCIGDPDYDFNFLLAIDNALNFRTEDRPQSVEHWAEMLLGNTPAPPLPESMTRAFNDPELFEKTQIMPPEGENSGASNSGHSMRGSQQYIDSKGRRINTNSGQPNSQRANSYRPQADLEQHNQPSSSPPPSADLDATIAAETFAPSDTVERSAPAPSYSMPESSLPPEHVQASTPRSQPPLNAQIAAQAAPPSSSYTPSIAQPKIPVNRPTRKPIQLPNNFVFYAAAAVLFVILITLVVSMLPDAESPKEPLVADNAPQQTAENTIRQLLDKAQLKMQQQAYTSPPNDNAIYYFNRVLELQGDNTDAQEGINRIVNHYVAQTQTALDQKDFQQVEANLRVIEAISPGSAAIQDVKIQFELAKNQYQQLDNYLQAAQQALDNKQFLSPDEDNAYKHFKDALELSPENEIAKQGLQKIADHYRTEIRHAIKVSDFSLAQEYLSNLEIVEPDSPDIAKIQDKISKSNENAKQIAQYLKNAKLYYAKGHFTKPSGKNAYQQYKNILKLEPKNRAALRGIRKIRTHYKTMFDLSIKSNDIADAKNIINTMKGISGSGKLVKSMRDDVAQLKKQLEDRPEIELISETVQKFKSSMESADIKHLVTISEFLNGRKQFIESFLNQYKEFDVDISGFRYIASEHRAMAKVKLSNLVNKKGKSVQPGTWSKFNIEIAKNSRSQWRIFW